jgi:hypothetical protein
MRGICIESHQSADLFWYLVQHKQRNARKQNVSMCSGRAALLLESEVRQEVVKEESVKVRSGCTE